MKSIGEGRSLEQGLQAVIISLRHILVTMDLDEYHPPEREMIMEVGSIIVEVK